MGMEPSVEDEDWDVEDACDESLAKREGEHENEELLFFAGEDHRKDVLKYQQRRSYHEKSY